MVDTWIVDPVTGTRRQATQEEADAMRAQADARRFGCLRFLGAIVAVLDIVAAIVRSSA